MATYRIVSLLFGSLSTFTAFIVMLIAIGVTVVLGKAKAPTGGGWLLVAARAGVWLATLGYLMLSMLSATVGLDVSFWLSIMLRLLLVVSYIMTIAAIVMIKPAPAQSHE